MHLLWGCFKCVTVDEEPGVVIDQAARQSRSSLIEGTGRSRGALGKAGRRRNRLDKIRHLFAKESVFSDADL
jgi:hypothetical protein